MKDKMEKDAGKPGECGNAVYNNIDHVQELSDEDVIKSGLYHQHAAWNFCGWVWYDKEEEVFKEEVWEYYSLVDTISAATIKSLIDKVNAEHGYE